MQEEKRKGVTKAQSKKKPWRAYIGYGKTFKHLGNFVTFQEAVEARIRAEQNLPPLSTLTQESIQEVMAKCQQKEKWFIRSLIFLKNKFNIPQYMIDKIIKLINQV